MTTPTFEDIQKLLFTLADAADINIRMGIYGRHDVQGRFSWESKDDLVNSIAHVPPAGDIPLIAPLDYSNMSDADIRKHCMLVSVLASGAMPRLKPGTNRRHATPDEVAMVIAWVRTLRLTAAIA